MQPMIMFILDTLPMATTKRGSFLASFFIKLAARRATERYNRQPQIKMGLGIFAQKNLKFDFFIKL